MATSTYDFTDDKAILQGATFSKTIVWKDSNEVAVNLTGYSARMQVRKNINSPDVIVELSTSNGSIALGGSAGTVTLSLSAVQTSAIAAKAGVYDLELTSADGTVTRLLSGIIEFSKEVTR